MSTVRPSARTAADIERGVWERAMRQLRVCSRLLAAVLVAVGARIVITGATPLTAVTATIIAVLLAASLLLSRQGRRHQPASGSATLTMRQKPKAIPPGMAGTPTGQNTGQRRHDLLHRR
jgi:hypothetical protein